MSESKKTSKPVFDKKLYQHDAFDKSVFRNARYVREIVEWICQDRQELLEILDVEHIEICPESYLDDELREYFVDVLYPRHEQHAFYFGKVQCNHSNH